MITWNENDRQFARHAAEIMGDRLRHDDTYEPEADGEVRDKLSRLGKGPADGGVGFLVTGDVIERDEAHALMAQVVEANLADWVPNASQRLIRRAGLVLGLAHPGQQVVDDHGPVAAHHPLTPDWVGGVYVQRCATCCRLFRA